MKKAFRYGKHVYDYALQIEDRKSLSLTVTPDMRVVVKAPETASEQRIEDFLKRKWLWLEKQLGYFRLHRKVARAREFVSGESMHYLGRQYKLVVNSRMDKSVKLTRGKICVGLGADTTDASLTEALLDDWLNERARNVFPERLEAMLSKFPKRKLPALTIKRMTKRWGSYLGTDRIILNRLLIHASSDCIDYVIVHELCHARHKNHTAAFYRLLNERFPGWERVKEKLELRYLSRGSLGDWQN